MLFKKGGSYDYDKEPTTLWNLPFMMVLFIGFATGSANQMVNPLLSSYAVGLGASLSLAGTIVGLQTGTAMLLRPISGAACDLLSRKMVMLASIIVTCLAYTGYLIFTSIPMIIFCRVLQGIAFAFMSVARTAFAIDYIPKNRIAEGVGYTSFGVILSQAVGPNIGLWIYESFGFWYCFLSALSLSIVGGVLISLVPQKTRKKPAADAEGGKNLMKARLSWRNLIAPEVIPYSLIAGLFTLGTTLVTSFLALVGAERSIPNVTLFFLAYSIVALCVRPIAGKFVDRRGLTMVLVPAYIIGGISMFLIGHATGVVMIILAGVCRALGQGAGQPGLQASAIKRLGRENAGVASATINMGQDLLSSIAPAIGGAVAASYGYTVMFDAAGILLTSGFGFYFLILYFEKRRSARKEALEASHD